MVLKYIIVCNLHFLGTILLLKFFNWIFPCHITSYYFQVADLLMFAAVYKLTFRYSKKVFFSEKLPPDGKAVLITGCARGIGNALAKHLDSKGYHVFASCRDPNSSGADDLRNSCSSRLKILQLDVTKDDSVEKALEYVKQNLGSCELWAVINNAGIHKGFITELTRIQDFKDTLEANVFGTVRVTKAFLPLLRKSRGRVINMTSLAGRIAIPYSSPYTVSKFASVGFSECLRHELDAWGIKVVSIEPEVFETDMTTEHKIMMRVEDSFNSVPEDVREDYGEEFLQNFKAISGRGLPPSPNLYKVSDAVDSAVSLKTPEAAYRVYRNSVVKFAVDIFEAWPTEIQLFAAKIYLRIWGMSVPAKVNKCL